MAAGLQLPAAAHADRETSFHLTCPSPHCHSNTQRLACKRAHANPKPPAQPHTSIAAGTLRPRAGGGNNTICAPGGSQRAAQKPCRLLAPPVHPNFLLSLEKKGGAMPGCLSRHEAWAQQTRLNPVVVAEYPRFHQCWKVPSVPEVPSVLEDCCNIPPWER